MVDYDVSIVPSFSKCFGAGECHVCLMIPEYGIFNCAALFILERPDLAQDGYFAKSFNGVD